MGAHVPIGIGPPNALTGTVVAGPSNLDMTTVTVVSLDVLLPGGSTAMWAADIVSATGQSAPGGSTLVWSHEFASSSGPGTATGDCPVKGVYMIGALLTVPGGTVPVDPRPLVVTPWPQS